MDISLSPEHQEFVAEKVAAGQYANPSDVVRGALESLKAQEVWTDADIAELREQIEAGIGQLNRGEGQPWSVDEIKAEGRSRLSRKQK